MSDETTKPERLNTGCRIVRWPDPTVGPYEIELTFGVAGGERHGRMDCVGVAVRAFSAEPGIDGAFPIYDPINDEELPMRPITSALLRKVPLGALVDEARSSFSNLSAKLLTPEEAREVDARLEAAGLRWGELSDEQLFKHYPPGLKEAAMARQPSTFDPPPAQRAGRRTRRGLDHFADVAVIYADAYRRGSRAPTHAVAKRWVVENATAAKWVVRARKAGFLSPTTNGTAGGDLLPSALEHSSAEMRPLAHAIMRGD